MDWTALAAILMAVFQGLTTIVLFCGVPFAFAVHGRLTAIETTLVVTTKRRDESKAERREQDRRIKALELACATCPLHPGSGKETARAVALNDDSNSDSDRS